METEDKIPCFIATAFPLKRWSQDGAVGVCTKPVILALEMLKQESALSVLLSHACRNYARAVVFNLCIQTCGVEGGVKQPFHRDRKSVV